MESAVGILACCLTHQATGTYVPAPEHSCAELCGNSVTQLFSRLLASRFPHPPGLLGDFKVGKGLRQGFISWEAASPSQTVTQNKSLLLQSVPQSSNGGPPGRLFFVLISTLLDILSEQKCQQQDFIGADRVVAPLLKSDSSGVTLKPNIKNSGVVARDVTGVVNPPTAEHESVCCETFLCVCL